jgi:hypothetical protein
MQQWTDGRAGTQASAVAVAAVVAVEVLSRAPNRGARLTAHALRIEKNHAVVARK